MVLVEGERIEFASVYDRPEKAFKDAKSFYDCGAERVSAEVLDNEQIRIVIEVRTKWLRHFFACVGEYITDEHLINAWETQADLHTGYSRGRGR